MKHKEGLSILWLIMQILIIYTFICRLFDYVVMMPIAFFDIKVETNP